jgi:hypothetical protein
MFLAVPTSRETTATLGCIPDGPPGIAATLRIMRQMVKDGRKSMMVRDTVLDLVSGLEQKDWLGEVRECHLFVRDQVRYVQDPYDVELVQIPDVTLQNRAGDCDDKATLLCAMLESIGHPARFVAVGFQPGVYEHVYVETRVGERWIACETTEPVDLGWAPPKSRIRALMYG